MEGLKKRSIKHWPVATLVNVFLVTIGSLIGIFFEKSFPEEIKSIVFQAIGLATLLIGIQMSLKIPNGMLLMLIFSTIIGGILGQLVQLDQLLQETGDTIKALLNIQSANFTDGLVTAFLIFCIGSMTIVGAIEEGLRGHRELLLIKSLLDGITSIALASTYGVGVWFVIFPLFFLQGGLTLAAGKVEHLFTTNLIAMISSTGGLLIIGVGIKLLNLGRINVENLLPALLVVGVFTFVYDSYWQGIQNYFSHLWKKINLIP